MTGESYSVAWSTFPLSPRRRVVKVIGGIVILRKDGRHFFGQLNLSDHKITRPGLTMCYLLLLRHGEGTDGSSHHIHIPGVLVCLALVSKVARTKYR